MLNLGTSAMTEIWYFCYKYQHNTTRKTATVISIILKLCSLTISLMFSNPLKKYRFLASVLTSTTRFHFFSYFLDMAVHVSGKIIKLDISRDLKGISIFIVFFHRISFRILRFDWCFFRLVSWVERNKVEHLRYHYRRKLVWKL